MRVDGFAETGAKPSLGGLREGSDRIPSLAQLERAQFGVDFEDAISVTLSQQDLGTTCRRDSLAVARAGTRGAAHGRSRRKT